MSDIIIVVPGRATQALVTGLTERGLNWIWTNMKLKSPASIHRDSVNDFREAVEADGLSVIIR